MSFRSLFATLFILAGGIDLFAQPSISGFSPAFGASTDPNNITIMGNGFAGTTLLVQFNGVTDPTAHVASQLGTSIIAHVAAGTPMGPGHIRVVVNGVETMSGGIFTVIGPGPYVSDFSPTNGGGGLDVTFNGAHFSGVTSVSFNGKNATAISFPSETSMKATTPAGVTSGPILVSAPSGSYSTTTNPTTPNFYVTPVLTGFTPFSGRAATNVIITGTNFLGTSAIQFGSTSAGSFTVLSNNAISVTIPAGAQTGKIGITAPAGFTQTSSNYVILPTLSSFSPLSGPVGTGVTITGANLLGATSVMFNGVAATFGAVTYSQLTSVVPAAAVSGPITVVTTNGTSVSSTLFYLPAAITTFTPTNSLPGTIVKITGVNFTNASAVSFNGTPATSFQVTNNTTIGAVVPPGFTSGALSVTTPAGTAVSTGLFYAPPGITSFNPTHGLPGTNVVLTGSNFLGATTVTFNGLAATFTVSNNTTLTATVPANAVSGPITVIAPAGTNTTAAPFTLDYSSDLFATVGNAPNPVFVGSNLVYTIVLGNNGPFSSLNTVWTNTLPPAVILKSATASRGTIVTNGNPIITGALGGLTNGSPVTVTLTVVPQSTGAITNTITVANDYSDPSPANNTATSVATVLPLPFLSIQRSSSNKFNLAWPVTLTNFGLQSRNLLTTNASWSNVTTAPIISGNQRVVTETNTDPAKFYRLKQ